MRLYFRRLFPSAHIGHVGRNKSSYKGFNICHKNSTWQVNRCSTLTHTNPALSTVYQQKVSDQEIHHDDHQKEIVEKLHTLQQQIVQYGTPNMEQLQRRSEQSNFTSFFNLTSLFGSNDNSSKTDEMKSKTTANQPKGIYLWGGVGCGKTFLMDLFYDTLPITRKRRVHFHTFMLEIHDRLHKQRQRQDHNTSWRGSDPLPFIAQQLMQEYHVLCFDEFQVTDIGDAMIMKRMFSSMLDNGLVMVATSNRPPSDLYKNGLQRELFVPCIEAIEDRCEIVHLASPTDYRLLGTQLGQTWLAPKLNTQSKSMKELTDQLNETFRVITKDNEPSPMTLTTQGRTIHVPYAVMDTRTARFSFNDLCARPLGVADYVAIAEKFSTVFLTDVPLLSLEDRNEVRRLITLIDTLYERKVKLFASAAAEPHALFRPYGHDQFIDETSEVSKRKSVATGVDKQRFENIDEVFAFDRTVSRLIEMQSKEYLQAEWSPN